MQDPLAYGLPHREPFIFVDGVAEVVPGTRAVCMKTFQAGEPFFRGHFPGEPIVPGVILTEALAQTAGIAAGRHDAAKSYRLSAIKQMKFFKPVRPLDAITLSAEKAGGVSGLLQFSVKATVSNDVVAEGMIILSEA